MSADVASAPLASASLLDALSAVPEELCRLLSAPEVCALALCRQGTADGTRALLPVRHLRLGRRGGGDGRDAAVLDAADWENVESLHATQTSLYAVQPGLLRACGLRELAVELLFQEPFGDILPEDAACSESLEQLELQCCYEEVLVGLARAVQTGSLPRLQWLRLRGSPKGAVAHAKGLRWPPARGAPLTREHGASNAGSAASELALALETATAIHSFEAHGVSAFGAMRRHRESPRELCPQGLAIIAIASRVPGLRRLALTDCDLLGHNLLRAIIGGLEVASPDLEILNLSPTPLCAEPSDDARGVGGDAGALLVRLRRLRYFRLAWCGLGDQGVLALAASIKLASSEVGMRIDDSSQHARNIQLHLDLHHNDISDLMGEQLKAVLTQHLPCTELRL
ncbi:unnamed protein product [Polarella glacialis]|uniref:Uncharacterized protein n=1 Tax=Polarella glacialis TaxID=89957 RepID=A0A813GQY1_POLGL|nr:unnamed protein product [Polarella glacialis]